MLTTRSDEPPTSEEYISNRSNEYEINTIDDFKMKRRCSEFQISTHRTVDSESFDRDSEKEILQSDISLKENYFNEIFDKIDEFESFNLLTKKIFIKLLKTCDDISIIQQETKNHL